MSASGAGLSVMSDTGLRFVLGSSPAYAEIEELQFTLGEGPCLTAYTDGVPVLLSDLSGESERWPGYVSATRDHGILAAFAFPLRVGGARLGALDVYRDRVGPLNDDALTLGLVFAEVAMSTLLDMDHRRGLLEPSSFDDLVAGAGAELYQAQGMVMVQLGVSLSEAMSRLRAYAFAHEIRLSEVAADVVARRITFQAEDPGAGPAREEEE